MKPWKPILLTVSVLGLLWVVSRAFWADGVADPVLSGKPMSQWLEALESEKPGSQVWGQAFRVLADTGPKTALQAQILDRIERRFSPMTLSWYRFYFGVNRAIRRRLPRPKFGQIGNQTVAFLDGISTNASPRQKAAIESIIRFGDFSQAIGMAYLVALSDATQSPPDAIAFVRRELGSLDSNRRLNLCEALRSKSRLDSWRSHSALVSGLKQDLSKLTTSDPNPDVAIAARKALEHLEFELGARSYPTTETHPAAGRLLELPSQEPTVSGAPQSPFDLNPKKLSTELRMDLAPLPIPRP